MKKMIIIVAIIFICGCDIGTSAFIYIKPESDIVAKDKIVLRNIEINTSLQIIEETVKKYELQKNENMNLFSHLSPIIIYGEENPSRSNGNLGLLFYEEDTKRLVVEIRALGGFRNRDLELLTK